MEKKLGIGIFVVLTTLPLLAGLCYSLFYSLGMVGILGKGFTLQNWVSLFTEGGGLLSLLYSLYLTLTSLVLILALALLFAWWQGGKTRPWFYKTLFLPLTMPPLITAFLWYYLLSPSGFLSRICYSIGLSSGIESFPRMVNDSFGIGILVCHVFLVFPLFTILFIHQANKERVAELQQMALTLGSTKLQFFVRVFVPLLLKRSSLLVILYTIFLLGTYEVPIIMGQSSPRTLSVFITEKLTRFDLTDIPEGHAMAFIYSIIVIALCSLLFRNKKINLSKL